MNGKVNYNHELKTKRVIFFLQAISAIIKTNQYGNILIMVI